MLRYHAFARLYFAGVLRGRVSRPADLRSLLRLKKLTVILPRVLSPSDVLLLPVH